MTQQAIEVLHLNLIDSINWSARIIGACVGLGLLGVTFALFDVSKQLRKRK